MISNISIFGVGICSSFTRFVSGTTSLENMRVNRVTGQKMSQIDEKFTSSHIDSLHSFKS